VTKTPEPQGKRFMNPTARTCFFLGFLACTAMLVIATYFQFVEGLEPCPLCISQRMMVLVVGLTMLVAAVQNPAATGIRIYSLTTLFFSLFGTAIAGRHVWLQSLPPEEVPECGPGLAYIFEHFPLSRTVELLLNGTGECAEVQWTFLGLNMPGWTLIGFLLLGLLGGLQYPNTPVTDQAEVKLS
jgi:disulfide bond formation protein DsbB